jgi:hypothetical protein
MLHSCTLQLYDGRYSNRSGPVENNDYFKILFIWYNSTYIVKVLLYNIDNDSECWEASLASLGLALVFGNMCDGGGASLQL